MLMADSGGGGSIANVISPFSSGAMDAAVKSVTAETQKLVDAAKGGGFKITPEGVEPLRKALLELVNDLTSLGDSTFTLDQAPQLGSHPYGHTVAAHDHKGATGEANSAGAVLRQLRQVAKQADEALARAAGLYKESEHQAIAATANFQL